LNLIDSGEEQVNYGNRGYLIGSCVVLFICLITNLIMMSDDEERIRYVKVNKWNSDRKN
jgi:hypothetical protein